MLKLLWFFLSFSVYAAPRVTYPPGGFQDNFWQQIQNQHIQTQQQLQSQDQYRRQLLQDQQWQLERLQDRQYKLDYMQRNSIMHDHSDRLRMYSQPPQVKPKALQQKRNK
jgi:hypothetical protein